MAGRIGVDLVAALLILLFSAEAERQQIKDKRKSIA
jgi:hypothetical protein